MDMGQIKMVSLILLVCVAFGCGDDDGTTPTPFPTPTPIATLPPGPSNPLCVGITPANDGPGGFLWKDGDHTGKLVVLLPGRYQVPFNRVTAERENGTIEALEYTGFANPDNEGERQHYRGNLPSARYKDFSLVIATEPGNTCSWKIKRAKNRND